MYDKEFEKYFEVDIEFPQMELPEESELDEGLYSIKNTKTGQRYSVSKYKDDKKLDKIRKAGGDHKHAAHYKDGKLIEEVEIDEADKKYPPTIETLKMIVKDKQNQIVKFKDGNARVDGYSASAMTQAYDAMKKPELKKKFEDQLKTKAGFLKIQAFSFSMVK